MSSPMETIAPPAVSGLSLVQLSLLRWIEEQEDERAAKYVMFREYYDGDHSSQLTMRLRKFLELKSGQEFNLNMCPIVVDALAEKLKVAGFTSDGPADLLALWWKKNRMDAQQAVVHLAAVRDGDTFVLVEWDNVNARPLFTQENAYDGTAGMRVIYSDERRTVPQVAIKRWTISAGLDITARRANLYFPDRIEKYVNSGPGWERFYEPDDERWPIPWVDRASRPLGIPVVHFRNMDEGYDHGKSELDNVVPMQNALNKTVIDVLAAADTTGFQVLWMTGGDPGASTNPDGSVKPGIAIAPGSWVYNTNPDAKIGAIEPADLDGIIKVADLWAAKIATITRTPLTLFQLTGQVAAADTIKEGRAGLISKARDRQTVFGNAWEDAMTMALRLYNTWGAGGAADDAEIAVVWEDDEKPDLLALAQTVNQLELAKAASTQQKVMILHPDWDPDAVAKEVAAIKDDQAFGEVPPIEPPAS